MRGTEALLPVERVTAAQRGDREALQRLISDHLAMLYNVAGRALGGHADVDDVVQETLLRVVENIGPVRDPARFSGWILAILHRQVADRMRRRHASIARLSPLDAAREVADPDADFAKATILRLGLSGQRRQVVAAVRWLDPADRFVLSLWWLGIARTRAAPDPTRTATAPAPVVRYGSVVDSVDAAPPAGRKPGRLPVRPEGTLTVTAGVDEDPRPDVVSLIRRG